MKSRVVEHLISAVREAVLKTPEHRSNSDNNDDAADDPENDLLPSPPLEFSLGEY